MAGDGTLRQRRFWLLLNQLREMTGASKAGVGKTLGLQQGHVSQLFREGGKKTWADDKTIESAREHLAANMNLAISDRFFSDRTLGDKPRFRDHLVSERRAEAPSEPSHTSTNGHSSASAVSVIETIVRKDARGDELLKAMQVLKKYPGATEREVAIALDALRLQRRGADSETEDDDAIEDGVAPEEELARNELAKKKHARIKPPSEPPPIDVKNPKPPAGRPRK